MLALGRKSAMQLRRGHVGGVGNGPCGGGSAQPQQPLAPADPEISLRIYYAQTGEALFDIARHYHVSPGQMLAANQLDPAVQILEEPRRLLVPGA